MSTTASTTYNAFSGISDHQAVILLAFIGGFYNVLGYIKLRGIFTSSITGNLVAACASSRRATGAISRSVVCSAFLLSGFVSSLIVFQLKTSFGWKARRLALAIFSIEMAFFIVVWIVGLHWDHLLDTAQSDDDWIICLLGALMGIAMGAHNIAAREAIPNCPPTTFMTSALVNVSTATSNYVSHLGKKLHTRRGIQASYTPVATSAAGIAEADGVVPIVDVEVERRVRLETDIDAQVEDSMAKFLVVTRPLISFAVGAVTGSFVGDYGTWHSTAVVIIVLSMLMGSILHRELAENEMAATAKSIATPPATATMNTSAALSGAVKCEMVPVNVDSSTTSSSNDSSSSSSNDSSAADKPTIVI